MGDIGLSQERIIGMLTERGINSGQEQSAKKLREAIAEVIIENNREMEKKIAEMVSKEFSTEIRKYISTKRY